MHFADGASPDVLVQQTGIIGGVALIAHLRGDFRCRGLLRELSDFLHGPGERLLHVHVLAEVHGRQRDGRVHVIGRGYHDRVDVLLLVEHLAVVGVAPGSEHLVRQSLRALDPLEHLLAVGIAPERFHLALPLLDLVEAIERASRPA